MTMAQCPRSVEIDNAIESKWATKVRFPENNGGQATKISETR
jgi:hypothetical protein